MSRELEWFCTYSMSSTPSTPVPTSLKLKHWLLKRIQKPRRTPLPEVRAGAGAATRELGGIVRALGMRKPLVVSDAMLVELGLVDKCTAGLARAGLDFALFCEVVPNPPVRQVEAGFRRYVDEGCDGLIAIGGGSPMDCCKIIGAKVMDGGAKAVEEYCGAFKVAGRTSSRAAVEKRKSYPPLVAIPTTAGTGSETTLAAVISFPEKQLKLTISDAAIIPKVAILDPEVTVSLPPHITAATGMDALTHAVESYLSQWRSPFTAYYSLRAVEKIGGYLEECYRNPSNLVAREMMLRASYQAGVAFTRTAVGYVHAVAHTLGAHFHTPHGVANAMVMPHVLDFYLEGDDALIDQLCDLAVAIGIGAEHPGSYASPASKRRLARAFVARVRQMNANMGVPSCVNNMTEADVDRVVDRALTESHGEGRSFDLFDFGYPTPRYMERADMVKVVRSILPGVSAAAGAARL